MSTRYEAYRMRDGKTPLSASYFNSVWESLDSRIGTLESISSELEDAIDRLTEIGLGRLEDQVTPVIEAALDLIAQAQAEVAEMQDIATNADLYALTGRADSSVLGYDGQDRVETITEQYGTEQKITTLAYDVNGRVSTIATQWDGMLRTETISYDGSGRVSSITASEEPAV